jgi:hypothetical protein
MNGPWPSWSVPFPIPTGTRIPCIVERLGIPAYWREHGYPPQCRRVGSTDFECT